ncbi:MAG: hypothetical protein AAF747_10720 [Planctomycetota bacterium]
MSRALLVASIVSVCSVLLIACASDPSQGWAFGSGFDEEVETIAVPVFANNTFATGLEARLTEAITKEIQTTTPWRIVRASSAELVLTGTITDAELGVLAIQEGTGFTLEQATEVVVDFEVERAGVGEPILARRNFAATASFVPTQPVGERLEVGQTDAINELARDIVAELRDNW